MLQHGAECPAQFILRHQQAGGEVVGFTLNGEGCAAFFHDAIIAAKQAAAVQMMFQGIMTQFMGDGEVAPAVVADGRVGHDVALPIIALGQRADEVWAGRDLAILDVFAGHDLIPYFVDTAALYILRQHVIGTLFDFTVCHHHPSHQKCRAGSAHPLRRAPPHPAFAASGQSADHGSAFQAEGLAVWALARQVLPLPDRS